MRKALLVALVLLVPSAVLGAIFHDSVAAAAQPVTSVIVGNTAQNPVPVTQQGTATVAGTVGLSATGNTVKLDAADSGKLDTLISRLGVDAKGALRTAATNDGAGPISINGDCQLTTMQGCSVNPPVPAGKVWVITNMSAQVASPSGKITNALCAMENAFEFLPLTKLSTSTAAGYDLYASSAQVNLHLVAGGQVACAVTTDDPAARGTLQWSMAGYEVDAS